VASGNSLSIRRSAPPDRKVRVARRCNGRCAPDHRPAKSDRFIPRLSPVLSADLTEECLSAHKADGRAARRFLSPLRNTRNSPETHRSPVVRVAWHTRAPGDRQVGSSVRARPSALPISLPHRTGSLSFSSLGDRNQLLRMGLCADLAQWRSAMHRDLAILKDPTFWGAMLLVVLPMVMAGAALVWWDTWPD
jgi:hypothetical protein